MYKYCEISRLRRGDGQTGAQILAKTILASGAEFPAAKATLFAGKVENLEYFSTMQQPADADLPAIREAIAELHEAIENLKEERLDNRASYEHRDLMDVLKLSLRSKVRPGEMLIWREAFRWKNDEGALPNHYEMKSLDELCEEFRYEVVHDFNHVAVVRRRRDELVV